MRLPRERCPHEGTVPRTRHLRKGKRGSMSTECGFISPGTAWMRLPPSQHRLIDRERDLVDLERGKENARDGGLLQKGGVRFLGCSGDDEDWDVCPFRAGG